MNSKQKFNGTLIVIVGPTASGKTDAAIEIAKYFDTQIISCDSRQFYKEIPIGTAAPTKNELDEVKHHFVGNLSVIDDYNASKFENDVMYLLNNELINSEFVVMTGGSGLYIDAVCKGIDLLPDIDVAIRENTKKLFEDNGISALQEKLSILDPDYFVEVDHNNPIRMMRAIEVCEQTGERYSYLRKNQAKKRDFDIVKIGIDVPREVLVQRINNRTESMMDLGWIDEARNVYKFRDCNSLNTVGYKELFSYFDGKITLRQAIEKIKTNTRRYAKRQMTWFRKDIEIFWFKSDELSEMKSFIK